MLYQCALLCVLALAPQEDIFSLSLEELMGVQVVTAARQEESAWDASSVISVLTSDEIQLFGGNNLFEVLSRMPAMQPYVAPGIDRMSVRGGYPANSYVHVLFLVDGRPLRASGGNLGLYYAFYGLPLSMIDRIEVVRGPGSVLYGTGAMEAVVNIITKTAEGNKNELRASFGSHSQKGSEAVIHHRQNGWNLSAGLRYQDAEGWDYKTPNLASAGAVYDVEQVFEDTKSVRLSLGNANWRLEILGGRTKNFAFTEFIPNLSWHSDVWLIDLGYERDLGGNWRMESHLTYNNESFDWMVFRDRVLPMETYDKLFETTFYNTIDEKWEVLFGTAIQFLDTRTLGGIYAIPFTHDVNTYSAYGQAKYRANERINLLFGAQYNKVEGFNDDLVPRFSFNYRVNEKLGMSLFYGKAFRSPQGIELLIETPGIQLGNPDLESEKVTSLEGRVFYHTTHRQVSFSVFQQKQKELIVLVPSEEYALGETVNRGELTTKGAELEMRLIGEKHYISGSAVYQENEDDAGFEDFARTPNWHLKLGLGYNGNRLMAGLFHTWSDNWKGTEPEGHALPFSPASQDYQLTSLNLGFNFKMGKLDGRLEAYGTNLFDEEVYGPDLLFFSYNSLPNWHSRMWSSSLRLKF